MVLNAEALKTAVTGHSSQCEKSKRDQEAIFIGMKPINLYNLLCCIYKITWFAFMAYFIIMTY